MRSNTKIALVVIALGILLSIVVAANKVYHKPINTRAEIAELSKAKKLKPLTADSTVPEILNSIEHSKYAWTFIEEFIDKVEFDPMINSDTFKFVPPADYKIDRSGRP